MILDINLSEQEYKVLESDEVIYRVINHYEMVQKPTERLYLEEETSCILNSKR